MSPLTGKFLADFSSFDEAVQKALVEFRSFETSASQVEKQLNRTADSFSGRKIISDATIAAAAVDKIGGASKLTEAEQGRLNRTITEALAKYRALGEDAPAALKKLADETKRADRTMEDAQKQTSKWKGQLGTLGNTLGATFSAAALVGFGRELLAMGDDLVKTADRTGLLIDEVQKLSFIGSQSGNTVEELTGAIGQMQNRLASGDKSAIGALKQLNITFDDLKNRDPYQQLQRIAQSIGGIENPANRVQIAMDLFGKTGSAILPTLTSEFDKLGEAAPRMAESTARSLDAAGDAIDEFKLRAKVLGAGMIELFSHTGDGIVLGLYPAFAKLDEGLAQVYRGFAKIPGISKVFSALQGNIDDLTQSAQWYRDAVKAQEHQLDALAIASTRTQKPVAALTVVTKDGAKAHKEKATLTAEEAHALELLKIAHDHVTAAMRLSEQWAQKNFEAFGRYAATIPHLNRELENLASRDLSKIKLGPVWDLPGKMPKMPQTNAFEALFGDPKQFGAQMASAIQGAIQGGGNVAAAASGFVGTKIGSHISESLLKDGGKFFKSALGEVFAGAIPVIGSLIGPLAGAIWNKLFGSAGRDAVKAFAEQHEGFDALHRELNALGADGERLWIKLTQGTGRNNPAQAQATINEITKALEAQAKKANEAGDAAAKEATTITASHQAALDAIKGMNDEMGRLFDSIKNEAPEKEMGVVERQTRDRITAIQKERDQAQSALDKTVENAAIAAKKAGDIIDDALASRLFHIRVKADVEGLDGVSSIRGGPTPPIFHEAAGGDFLVQRPTLFLAGEAGPERATFSGAGRTSAATEQPTPIIFNVDGVEWLRQFVVLKKRYVG